MGWGARKWHGSSAVLACTGVATLAWACGAERAASSRVAGQEGTLSGAASPPSQGAVSGTVLDDRDRHPLAGRSVAIGDAHAVTDDFGRFTIPAAPSPYDLLIVEPDGTIVSLYAGITRRDVLVKHHKSASDFSLPANVATITGTLTGGPEWPLDKTEHANVLVASAYSVSQTTIGGGLPSRRGPSFGPFYVRWDGEPAPAAEAYAWASYRSGPTDAGAEDASRAFAFGERPLTLHDGGVDVSLRLDAVAQTAHVSGTVAHPAYSPATQKSVYYALPGLATVSVYVAGDSKHTDAFDFVVPVLQIPGASLCFSAFSSTGDARAPIILGAVCGLTPDAPVRARLQAPPTLTSPAPKTTVTPATTFSWTLFDGGVYELQLIAKPPSGSTPEIHVYTAARSMKWPDLSAAYVRFPAEADYECSVVGLGAFASIDELVGPAGIGAPIQPDFRRSYLPGVQISVVR
jgi:hypothetical protein